MAPPPLTPMRAVRSLMINMLAMLVVSFVLMTGALAHAGLVAADPADGIVLPTAPALLNLSFTEPVTPLVFTLVDPSGQRLDLEGAVATDQQVSQPLPHGLGRGTHLVSWRVVSADGHPVSGSLIFSIGEPGARPVAAAGTDALVTTTIWVVRALLYAALFLAVGTTVFGWLVAPLRGTTRVVPVLLSSAGLLLLPLALGLQGLDALGTGFGRLLSPAPWSTALATSYATTILACVVAFAATLASAFCARGRAYAGLVLVAWIAAALAPMLSGHAGTASPEWLSRPAVFVHVAALLFWVGALCPLARMLWSGDETQTDALRRFSRLIPLAIAPLIASGLLLAGLQMGPPGAAWQSPYGLLLGAKLLLLVVLFALALWNRLALTGPVLAGTASAQTRLRRSIVLELILVVVILGVVAGWRFTPPPRVIAEIAAQPARLHIHTQAAMADITVPAIHAGGTTMRIWLTDSELVPLAPKAVSVALSNPGLGIERLRRPAVLGSDGFWQVPLTLPSAGLWSVDIDIRIDDFTVVKLAGHIELKP